MNSAGMNNTSNIQYQEYNLTQIFKCWAYVYEEYLNTITFVRGSTNITLFILGSNELTQMIE